MEDKCVNTIRCLVSDIVEKAKSGHPGGAMGCAPMAHVLWSRIMNFNPQLPNWMNRDRFILSNGHISSLQYTILHLAGYDISMEDLKLFRQLKSKTPGHPENNRTPGVEVSTGPLGQGICNAVGMAIAERHLATLYNRDNLSIIDHHTYVICGDGCLEEGMTSEAISIAGHLKLGKLIVLYDDNHITIDGSTDLTFTEDTIKKFEACGWHCQFVRDGDTNIDSITNAILNAKLEKNKPSLIKIQTTIGYGSAKQGSSSCHGAPLGKECVSEVKKNFGMDPSQHFHVSEDVYSYYKSSSKIVLERYHKWVQLEDEYKTKYPDLYKELARRMENVLPDNINDCLDSIALNTKPVATRVSSGKFLNELAKHIPELMGGSADLVSSTNSFLSNQGIFSFEHPEGRNIYFGIREHAMSAICNGLFCHGGVRPFCATFFSFIQYMIGGVRLSGLNKCPVLYIMTHDSIGVGEDGPTHQPIEHLAQCRCIPNMHTIRPADEKETLGAYKFAFSNNTTPVILALSRQVVPQLQYTDAYHVQYGAYIVHEEDKTELPELILISTGSELGLVVDAVKYIGKRVRVVSMPCMSLFDSQPKKYKQSLLLPNIPCISIEAGSSFGWGKYSDFHIGIDEFGESAPSQDVYKYFGLESETIAKKCLEYLKEE